MVAEKRLWFTPDGKVFAGEEPPDGSQLIAGEGTPVNDGTLARFAGNDGEPLKTHDILRYLTDAPAPEVPTSSSAGDVAALRAEVEELKGKVAAMEEKRGAPVARPANVADLVPESDETAAAEAKAQAAPSETKAVAGPQATKGLGFGRRTS